MRYFQKITLLILVSMLALCGCGKGSEKVYSFEDMNEYQDAKIIEEPGTYSKDYEVLAVVSTNVILEDCKIGRLLIAKEVGDGEVLLSGVEVGTLDIQGGGKASVHLEGSSVEQAKIDKEDGTVAVDVKEGSNVGSMDAKNASVTVEPGTNVSDLKLSENSEGKVEKNGSVGSMQVSDVNASASIAGNAGTVVANAPEASVTVEETGSVSEVEVSEGADNANVEIHGEVDSLNVKEPSASVTISETAKVKRKSIAKHDEPPIEEEDTSTPAHKHRYRTLVSETKATCQAEGTRVYQCNKCDSLKTVTDPIAQHSYNFQSSTSPSCTAAGINQYVCSVCGSGMSKELEALGHFYNEGEVTEEATCSEEGTKTFECVRCGDTYTEEIETIAHNFNDHKQCDVCKIYYPSTNKDLENVIALMHEKGNITISLRKDLTLNANAVFKGNVTIEGNGNTLLLNTSGNNSVSVIEIEKGTLTVKDITLERAKNENYTFSNEEIHLKGDMKFSNVTINSAVKLEDDCDYTFDNVTINETKYSNAALTIGNDCNVTMSNSTINATATGASAIVFDEITLKSVFEKNKDYSGIGGSLPVQYEYIINDDVDQIKNVLNLTKTKIVSKKGYAIEVKIENTKDDPSDTKIDPTKEKSTLEYLINEKTIIVDITLKGNDFTGVADKSKDYTINDDKFKDLISVTSR